MICFLFLSVCSGHVVDNGLEGRKYKLGKQLEVFCVCPEGRWHLDCDCSAGLIEQSPADLA